MKKKLIFILIICLGIKTSLLSQNFDKIKLNLFFLKKIESAKKDFDKILTKKPDVLNSPEGSFYNLALKLELSKDEKFKNENPLSLNDLLNLFNDYHSKDDTFKYLKENNYPTPLFDIYQKYAELATANFNDKNWLEAAENFKNSQTYSNLIYSNGFTSYPRNAYDTNTVFYIAISYQNAKKYELALPYFEKLALDDYNLENDGKNIYNFILVVTGDNGQKDEFNKFLNLAKQKLPKEDWDAYQFDYIYKTKNINDINDLYNQFQNENKLSEENYLQFADLFNNIGERFPDLNQEAISNYKLKAIECLKKANELNPDNYLVSYNLGVNYRNDIDNLDQKYYELVKKLREINAKPITEKDPAKKKKLIEKREADSKPIKDEMANLDIQIIDLSKITMTWLNKSLEILKNKSPLETKEIDYGRRLCNMLAELSEKIRDKYRGNDPKQFDEYDALFNNYEKLVEKFKSE